MSASLAKPRVNFFHLTIRTTFIYIVYYHALARYYELLSRKYTTNGNTLLRSLRITVVHKRPLLISIIYRYI